MALKRPKGPAGTLVVLEHTSKILAGNPLGDPHVRKLGVWLPPQYDGGAGKRRFPAFYDLVGFTGSGLAHANWKPFGDNVPERAARLIHEQKMGPAIFVFPDCFTALGGNQYVNSSAIGNYADYLTREIIPFVDREFRTLASREHRGCFGKSSGGYGSIIHGMKYAKHWGAIANHSGDAYFDFVYWADWPNTLNELAKHRTPKRKPGLYDVRARSRPQGPRRGARRRAHQALSGAGLEEGEALRSRKPLHHEPVHGGHVRPGSQGAARLSRAVQPRDRASPSSGAGASGAGTTRSISSPATAPISSPCGASTSIAAGATSITSTTARASCRSASPRPASATATRNSTTTTPTSTTGWT